MSSLVAHSTQDVVEFDERLTGRNIHRYRGFLIATGAGFGLWGVIATAAWGIVSLLG